MIAVFLFHFLLHLVVISAGNRLRLVLTGAQPVEAKGGAGAEQAVYMSGLGVLAG